MSRRISDKTNSNLKYAIIVAKEAAPFESLSFETRQTIRVFPISTFKILF
jgi:hypothetical protein